MPERRNIAVTGLVQGVGFRETVRRIALRHAVAGFVRNVGWDTVEIDVEGEPAALVAFVAEVLAMPPRHARVENVRTTSAPARGAAGFIVAPSVPPP